MAKAAFNRKRKLRTNSKFKNKQQNLPTLTCRVYYYYYYYTAVKHESRTKQKKNKCNGDKWIRGVSRTGKNTNSEVLHQMATKGEN